MTKAHPAITDLSTPDPRPEHSAMSTPPDDSNTRTPPRLSRLQQLTLNTWRLATAKLDRVLDAHAVLEHTAIHATLGALRDVDAPLALFQRHADAQHEFRLVGSLVGSSGRDDLAYDLMDAAFLLRWNELVADGTGPEELPPLQPHPSAANRLAQPDRSTGELVLERLPSGEFAWLRPDPERTDALGARYELTDSGRRALAMHALFGDHWPTVAEACADASA